MTQPLDFQTIIFTLQKFWADQGCLIWQPYYQQVGAGTMNPATALRVLGPEPWNVAYVEPTIRPDDGRYGENPNRMQMHYQFQVILKPDPGNPQELYLQSLQALGIDLSLHDVRFVEDNWESPALGAWGLGWEVWLDGQEITQFTYFQQAGGRLCDPVSVEITYGLDRIAIALQRVKGFTEIRWNDTLTCGDVNLAAEQEHSRYYFEIADVQRLQQMYDLYEHEAEACLENNLVLPAHDYMLKCSHTFNVLDSRGAIGVTERQAYFGRMRELSRRISDHYLDQRQRLEYPWLKENEAAPSGPGSTASAGGPNRPAPFLLEIGSEELPANDLDQLLEQLKERSAAFLDELRLAHGKINVYGTPRRLVMYVDALNPVQPDLEQLIKGPPAARAYDTLGQPTPAAQGFARSRGISVHDLKVQEIDGGQYVTANVSQKGRPALTVLAEALPGFIASLKVDKAMRWNASNIYFSRPLRWLLALYGEAVVPFQYAGLETGRITRGLRMGEPAEFEARSSEDYLRYLQAQGILLDREERQQVIAGQVAQMASQVNGTTPEDASLLAEVTNLVEAPSVILGSFDASHLALPREVLTSVMKKHQRYFPLMSGEKLLPYFVAVCNRGTQIPGGMELIVEGNEHVVRARFADANFFVREDRKHKLEHYLERLASLTFQTRLGSMLDKVKRIARLVERLSPQLGLTESEQATAQRAAQLCKADLGTHMVVEMTSLQGLMGRYYALQDGESADVAQAIYEHYLPRFTGDTAPESKAGMVIGIADRLDTLSGLFAAGMAPSGAKDPFAQRRAALGLVQGLIAHNLNFNVRYAIQELAAQELPISAEPDRLEACIQFVIERLRNYLLDQHLRYDIVDAVLAVQGHNPARAYQAAQELTRWVERPDWNTILPAFARCVRITRDIGERLAVQPESFVEAVETELWEAVGAAEKAIHNPASPEAFLQAFLPLIPLINRYFDTVLVMTEDTAVRQNRLGLLQRIAGSGSLCADFSRLEGF